jgi:SAM-dependent methyltransferase
MDPAIDRARALFVEARGERQALLETLFRLERPIVRGEALRVLGDQGTDDLAAIGLLHDASDCVVPRVRVTQFRGQLIASDRLGFRRHAEFVMGPGPASALLADAIRPPARGRILDLGCGPGTQGLWLASDDVEVLGLDISKRALAFAAFNQRFNARSGTTFASGDFLTAPADPALDERFDLALANPPFVLAPVTELLYRDRPLPGNGATQTAVERVARVIAPGGRGYVLGTWFDAGRGPWDATARAWLRGLGVRGAIARVSSCSPTAYAELWNRDLDEPDRSHAVEAWSAGLEAEGASRITTGVVALARPARHLRLHPDVIVALDNGRPAWPALEQALAS